MKAVGKLLAHDGMTAEEITAILEEYRWLRLQERLTQHRAVEGVDHLDALHAAETTAG